jgi:hypothetical protein
MRPLKFRAWDKTEKKMTSVTDISFNDDGRVVVTVFQPTPKDKYYYRLIEGENCILMQFVGLQDKHGKDVYEGDIIKAIAESTYNRNISVTAKVEIAENGLLAPFWIRVRWGEEWWIDTVVDGFEIIGNIYEHPELISQEAT